MKFKIKQTIYALSLSVMVLAGPGCNKFLEEEDPSNLTEDNYYTLPAHAEAAIAAAYAQTRFIGGGAGIFVWNFSLLEAVTGAARTETGQNSDLNNLFGLVYNGDNLLVRNWWNGLYNLIQQTNLAITNVPKIPVMDEAQRKRIIGEASFLRAWAYFYAVQLWGDVPLITHPIRGTDDPDFYPVRTGTQAVYDQIVADLTTAENAGLPWTDNTGRVSMGAAKGLLAKVYLAMAGFPLSKGASHYQLAATKANEVITSTQFSLFPTYNDLHTLNQENRGEHMFMIQYLASVAGSPMQQAMLPYYKGISAYSDEIGTTTPVRQFYESYEAGDRRAQDRVGFFYTSYYDGGNGALKALNAPYIYKNFDVIAHGTLGTAGTARSDMNWPILRYADVLLTYAEAQNEVGNGPNAAAYDALKKIRDRANLTTPAIGSYNKASFQTAVWKERWYELCYEGITWFDMVRLRKGFNFATKSFDNFEGYTFADNGAKLAKKHLLFPLPTEEMKNNPNLKPQNEGY